MKIILNGCEGKMGRVVYQYLKGKYEYILPCDINSPLKEEQVKDYDVIIDFTNVDSAKKIIEYGLKYQKHLIIGTTGFSKDEIAYFKKKSEEREISLYIVANFLKSISELRKLIKNVEYDQIICDELHHYSKVDAPSGTALYLLEDTIKPKFRSFRTNFFAYEHKIFLINDFETIEITHKCYNKQGYAKGVEIALKNIGKFKGLKREI